MSSKGDTSPATLIIVILIAILIVAVAGLRDAEYKSLKVVKPCEEIIPELVHPNDYDSEEH